MSRYYSFFCNFLLLNTSNMATVSFTYVSQCLSFGLLCLITWSSFSSMIVSARNKMYTHQDEQSDPAILRMTNTSIKVHLTYWNESSIAKLIASFIGIALLWLATIWQCYNLQEAAKESITQSRRHIKFDQRNVSVAFDDTMSVINFHMDNAHPMASTPWKGPDSMASQFLTSGEQTSTVTADKKNLTYPVRKNLSEELSAASSSPGSLPGPSDATYTDCVRYTVNTVPPSPSTSQPNSPATPISTPASTSQSSSPQFDDVSLDSTPVLSPTSASSHSTSK